MRRKIFCLLLALSFVSPLQLERVLAMELADLASLSSHAGMEDGQKMPCHDALQPVSSDMDSGNHQQCQACCLAFAAMAATDMQVAIYPQTRPSIESVGYLPVIMPISPRPPLSA